MRSLPGDSARLYFAHRRIALVHLQDKLSTMIGKSSGFLEPLPAQTRARIEFLRELQDKHDDFNEEYQKELKALREKYEAKYGRLPQRALPWLSQKLATHCIRPCSQWDAVLQQACSSYA